ncbi:MAG: hypothetical protein O6928_09710 [Gammaproteobacteria bacterium]|nr:hypothetical protein [Gammaproteobacteria bacterium]
MSQILSLAIPLFLHIAFDPHELLCHFIAAKAGLYERAGLQIELTDITFIADADLPRQTFQVCCGSALISAIIRDTAKGGVRVNVTADVLVILDKQL